MFSIAGVADITFIRMFRVKIMAKLQRLRQTQKSEENPRNELHCSLFILPPQIQFD